MFCYSCGHEIPDDSAFCPDCKAQIPWNSAPAEAPVESDSILPDAVSGASTPEQAPQMVPDSVEQTEPQPASTVEKEASFEKEAPASYFRTQYGTYEAVGNGAAEEHSFRLKKDSPFVVQFQVAWKNLARRIALGFTAPQELQKELEVSKDYGMLLMVTVPVLLLSFLSTSFCMRTLIYRLVTLVDGRSVNSVSYLYGNVISSYAFRFGAATIITQIFAMLIGSLIPMLALQLLEKQPFSLWKASGFLTVLSLPTLCVSLLGLIFSFFAPIITLALMVLGLLYNGIQQYCLIQANIQRKDRAAFVVATVACLVSALLVVLVCGAISLDTLKGFVNGLI